MIPNEYPSLNYDLGDTADMLRDTVRSFTSDNIAPIADEIKILATTFVHAGKLLGTKPLGVSRA